MRRCVMFAAAGLTALFVSLPVSLSLSPFSSLPQLTTTKAEAWVTHRRARVATRRGYYAHQDGAGGYPYSSGYYAYRGVYAPPVRHWGPVRGWHWWR